MGRAAQITHHDNAAQTLYRRVIRELPFSYYALLASWFGKIDLSNMMDAELPTAKKEIPPLNAADVVHIHRAEFFISNAAPELAQYELKDVHVQADMPNEFLVYLTLLNHMAGSHQLAFHIFSALSTRNFQGLFSTFGQRLLFPYDALPLIKRVLKGHPDAVTDPVLVLSVIKQESAFNPEAISVSNALGMMQLIPPTAKELEPEVQLMDLFDPVENIKLGARYLGQLARQYKGNIINVLAAYNAGPPSANRWTREAAKLSRDGGSLPPEEFIETIGFHETHDYIENILRNYYWYTYRLTGDRFNDFETMLQTLNRKCMMSPSRTM
jgi:soluble lytic murein transglycosylase